MKITCPVCGVQGVLQKRGNSYRIQHYRGYVSDRRFYQYHRIDPSYVSSVMEVNGSKSMEVKDLSLGLINQNKSRGSLAWLGRQTHNLENKKRASA